MFVSTPAPSIQAFCLLPAAANIAPQIVQHWLEHLCGCLELFFLLRSQPGDCTPQTIGGLCDDLWENIVAILHKLRLYRACYVSEAG